VYLQYPKATKAPERLAGISEKNNNHHHILNFALLTIYSSPSPYFADSKMDNT